MPRKPKGYRDHGTFRAQFVERMEDEQQRRGLSDGALAKLVSKHYPMTGATIWKIKKLDPPKRVDLDEGHAIALALGFNTVTDLMLGESARHSIIELQLAADKALDATTVIESLSGMLAPPMALMLGQDETASLAILERDIHADALTDSHNRERVAESIDEVVDALRLLASSINRMDVEALITTGEATSKTIRGES